MRGSLKRVFATAWHTPSGQVGAVTLLLIALVAVTITPFLPDPRIMPDLSGGAAPPSFAHPFGTDAFSRDILSRVVHGARVSLSIAALAVALSISLGAAVGTTAGYFGGWVDAVLMRSVDAAMAIPRLFILLLLVLVWERIPPAALVAVIGATGWFATSRLVRGEVLRLRELDYIRAAKALGAGSPGIIFRHVLPNTLGPLIVAATLGVGEVILLEAGLSFLGLGIAPPTPTWGGMVHDSESLMATAPWTGLFPGAAIVITVLAVNLWGEAMRAAVDPRTA